MPTQAGGDNNIWHFIRVSDFSPPAEPPAEAFRLNLRAFWNRLRHSTQDPTLAGIDLPEVQPAPRSLLDWLAPTPDWTEELAGALDQVLSPRGDLRVEEGLCPVVIGPPHSRMQDAVRRWAERHDLTIMGPPAAHKILTDPLGWINAWPSDPQQLVVVPALECCFLRHHRGLELVRWLTDRIWTTNQRCIIACDSWAWVYLSHAAQVNLVQPNPLTLAPLGAAELEQWLVSVIYGSEGRNITFRRSDNGRKVIRRPDQPDDQEHSKEFLIHLAAYSRGNPGVAWAIWRRSLGIAEDEDVKEAAQAEAARDRGLTVWVRPWEKVMLPRLARPPHDVTLFVLHSLLLHHGLPTSVLDDLLELSRTEAGQQLQWLRLAEIAQLENDFWRTTPAAYPGVRDILREAGFLTDAL